MGFKCIHNQGGVEYVRETYMDEGWITLERVEPGTVRLIHGTLYQAHNVSAHHFVPGFPKRYKTLWVRLRHDALPQPPAPPNRSAGTVHVNVEARGVEKAEEQFKRLDERLASVLAKQVQSAALAAKKSARRRKVKP